MKENGRAKVYGTNSYGKGVQQRIIKIKDLSKTYGVLKITTEKVLTPLGNCIQGVGITPDTYTDTSYYKYYNNLVRSPYMESSYRLTYLQEQSVLTSIKHLDGYSTCNTYSEAITKFQGEFKDSNGLTVNGNYDTRTLYALYGEMNKLYNQGYNQELEFVIDESLK
jgi:carboxyl-terminal processing protease